MKPLLALSLVFTTAVCLAQATIFEDRDVLKLIEKGADHIYKQQPDSTEKYIRQIAARYPDHPIVPAMEAFEILWLHIPVLDGPVFESFEKKLKETQVRAEKLGEEQVDGYFFKMAASGLLAEHYADQGNYMKAFGEANVTYTYLKKGFDLVDEYPEFLFLVGLYNYFRVVYPEKHPVYTPLLWFFRSGDREAGLEQIHRALTETTLSRVEAHVYLSYIYLRYEEKPEKAMDILDKMLAMYPDNPYIIAKYLEGCYATGRYSRLTATYTDKLKKNKMGYYQMVGGIFEGVYMEKVKNDPQRALFIYRSALEKGSGLENHGEYYKCVAYLGLGRVYTSLKVAEEARQNYRLALQYAETSEMKIEAERGLKQ